MIASFGGIGACKRKVAAFEECRLTQCSDEFAGDAGTLTASCLAKDVKYFVVSDGQTGLTVPTDTKSCPTA